MPELVLLDRDGTLIKDQHYLADPAGVELLHGAAEGVKRVRALGFAAVVITNQSGLARGYFDRAALDRIHGRIQDLLGGQGTCLDGVYVCPHGPSDGCRCRKPAPGLAHEAARRFGAELARSFVVGDRLCDIELGMAVGATTLLVRGERHRAETAAADPDHVVGDLVEAAEIIRTAARGERR